jgi:hypothetical protein
MVQMRQWCKGSYYSLHGFIRPHLRGALSNVLLEVHAAFRVVELAYIGGEYT